MATTSSSRLQRFRDFLPAAILEKVVLQHDDTEPLFSPTCQQPNLLHSVFSPNGGSGFQRNVLRTKYQTSPNGEEPSPNENATDATKAPPAGKNGAARITNERLHKRTDGDTTKLPQPSSTGPDLTSIFVSPTHTALSSLAVSMVDPELYIHTSPHSFQHQASSSPRQEEWLTVDGIASCVSVSQLVRTVTALEGSAADYPSLLRTARERLRAVRGFGISTSGSPNSVMDDTFHSVLNQTFMSAAALHDDDDACAVTSQDKTIQSTSSLVMSISTDASNNEENTAPSPTFEVKATTKSNFSSISPASLATNRKHVRAVVPATTGDTNTRGLSATEQQLWDQVQRLTQTIAEMEQSDHFFKTATSLQAHQQIDSPLAQEQSLSEHVATANELWQSLEELQGQNRRLKEQLQQESDIRGEKLRHSAAVEKRLSADIRQLEMQLATASQTSHAAQDQHQRQHAHFQRLLMSTQANLQRVQADRDVLIRSLSEEVGRKSSTITTRVDRDRLLADFESRSAARQRALDSMTKALAIADHEKRSAKDARRKSEGLLVEATRARCRLERETAALMEQIKYLSAELHDSREQLEELWQAAQRDERAAWEEREFKYKRIIREMKEQIRKQVNAVPVGLYRTAVAEAKQHAVECQSYRAAAASLEIQVERLERAMHAQKNGRPTKQTNEVNKLSFVGDHPSTLTAPKMSNLSKIMSQVATEKPAIKLSNTTLDHLHAASPATKVDTAAASTIASVKKPAAKIVNCNVPVESDEAMSLHPKTPSNNEPRTPRLPRRCPTPPAAGSKTPSRLEYTWTPATLGSEGRSRIRVSMVRAAGGRMGLQKRLREMRSPTPSRQRNTAAGLQKYQKKLEQMNIRSRPLRGIGNQ